MTPQDNMEKEKAATEQRPEPGPEPEEKEAGIAPPVREIPKITREEDAPFPPLTVKGIKSSKADSRLNQTDSLDKEITRFRYRTGRQVLFIAMGLMCVAVVIDLVASAIQLESSLISSAFEAFKLITMTVLGYIFGSSGWNGSSGGKSN